MVSYCSRATCRRNHARRALAEQGATPPPAVLLLIARGAVHPTTRSTARRAHEIAGALQRHLTGATPVLAKLLPAELARAWQALPIGRCAAAS